MKLWRAILSMASLTSTFAFVPRAHALQPLEDFVASAETLSVDAQEARATALQRGEEAKAAWGKLGPALNARASLTRNQYPAVLPPSPFTMNERIVITPKNEADASIAATLPIVDVGSWLRIAGADATSDAARLRAAATGVDLAKSVARNYYQVVAADASIGAAKRALTASQDNAKVVRDRLGAGTASELDLQRAQAEVERAKQTLAAALGSYATSKRALESGTGISAQDGAMPSLEDGLRDEVPLPELEPGAVTLPQVRASQLETKAAARNAQAAWAALAPTVAASATERFTNATGFSNVSSYYTLVLQATWNVDASTYFNAKAQDAAHGVAKAREGRTVLAAKDDLFNAWQQVRTQIATAAAAKASLDASKKAAGLVRERYAVGSATQLEVTQADRDVLSAEMSVIQAYADLAYARMLVKLDSGRDAKGGAR
jgi:outer membrane protein TolC